MIFDLTQLNCFVAVAEELHFGRAARRLCMTQPPLSRQIQLLEHALGVGLLARSSRSVRLTAAGRVFLVDARHLLRLARQAAASAQRAGMGKAGRVTIGFTSVMGFDLMPKLIASAQHVLPDIDVVLKEMVTVHQLEALEKNAIDLGFLRPLASRLALKHQTVVRESLVAVLPADHALAARQSIALRDLDGLPFIMYSADQGKYFHSLVHGLFVSSGIMPKYIQHLDYVSTVVGLVRSGLGVSIVPASAAQIRFDDLVFRPIPDIGAMAESRMVWRADHDNPALATFRDFAADFFARRTRGDVCARKGRDETGPGANGGRG